MAGLVPAIPVFSCLNSAKTRMPGTKPGQDEREPCVSKSHSFYAAVTYENAIADAQSTKEFCEIAAAVISPSYCLLASFLCRVIGHRGST
jgi:hypothetical protein